MENPFVFGIPVSGNHFMGRENEYEMLIQNLKSGKNTAIISPRQWGKTSLIKKAIHHLSEHEQKRGIISIDGTFCRTEADFYRLFASELIRQTYHRYDERADKTRRFLSNVSPHVSFGPDPDTGFRISFETKEIKLLQQEILLLPQKIYEDTSTHLIVFIDEFQQLAGQTNSGIFLKKLRPAWQNQPGITLCLAGSRRQYLQKLFLKPDKPLYRFCENILLPKISVTEWIRYICSQFENTEKLIPAEIAKHICLTVDCHSAYVQQLSWLVWNKTAKIAGLKEFTDSLEILLSHNSTLFGRMISDLTQYQLSFVRALADGLESEFTSVRNMKKYELASSANVARIKQALDQKEIIDIERKRITLTDPVFKTWIRRNYSERYI